MNSPGVYFRKNQFLTYFGKLIKKRPVGGLSLPIRKPVS